MHKLILGALLVPALVSPVFAGCYPEYDPMIGVFWDCGYGGVFTAAQGAGGSAPPAVPCHTNFVGENCPTQEGRVGDGGVNGSDALGFAAAATAFGVTAVSGSFGAIGAAAMAVGAAAAGPVSDAANSGAVGDAAAASASEGGGY